MSYEKRIIGFIDILGFGQLVLDSESDSKKFDLIQSVLSKIHHVDDIYGSPSSFWAHSNYENLADEGREQLDKVFDLMKSKAEASRVRITTFSDSIVFSCPASTDGISNFRYFLIKLLVHTNEFKLLLRGGIACGSLVHSETSIFGPAMNCAYYTENKVAVQPRIAIDETFMLLLQNLGKEPIINIIKEELIVDEVDSVKYIDQLSLLTNMVAQNMCGANPYDMLVNEKSTIEALINSNGADDKVMAKLHWYKSYFNEYIHRNPEVELTVSNSMGAPVSTVFKSVSHLKIQNA
ncbi:MAG: hypothetical protein WAT12_04340 [Candidatus Nitrotoga sp.]